jgi:hypothetical protein
MFEYSIPYVGSIDEWCGYQSKLLEVVGRNHYGYRHPVYHRTDKWKYHG